VPCTRGLCRGLRGFFARIARRLEHTPREVTAAKTESYASVLDETIKYALHFDQVLRDICKALYYDVSYPGWGYELARKKCFYIRGLPWFHSVLTDARLNVSKFNVDENHESNLVPKMLEVLQSRTDWHQPGFDWNEEFSYRQFNDAVSRATHSPLSFTYAVKVLVFCELIVQRIHGLGRTVFTGDAVYSHMSIEPAASFISKLTPEMLKQLYKDVNVIEQLRLYTGQVNTEVIDDMAKGRTVTHKLALRVHQVLLRNGVRNCDIDPPAHRYHQKHRKVVPSRHETVDIDESTLPAL
jgi:hypothetical protein